MRKNQNSSPSIPCFKRWSRKPYGIFASLGRCVKIGVLSVAMSIILLATNIAKAQTTDTVEYAKRIQMESIEVTGSKASPTRSAMSQTTLYNRAVNSVQPLQTVEAAMRLNPSIDIRERGGKGVQSDISIRGGSFDQTQLMLNGINFTDARTGHQTHSLPIDIESVAGIDLIDGVSGVGAYAGAINIRTQPIRPTYLRLEASGGDHGYAYTNLSGAWSEGGLQLFGATSYRQSCGYTQNTAFMNLNSYLRAVYQTKSGGLWDAQAGFQQRWFGANGFYSLAYPMQFEHTRTWIASIRNITPLSRAISLNSSLSYRRNHDRFELVKGAPNRVPYNFNQTDNIGAELWADINRGAGRSSIGGDYIYNHIYSTVLGETLDTPHGRYTKAKSRNVANVWVRHTKQWDKFNASGSVGVGFTPYGQSAIWSVAGGYKPSQYWYIDVGAAQSMRLPTFNDLYYTTTGYIGNPELKPERATTLRNGVSYNRDAWRLSTMIYYRMGRNTIDWVRESATADWRSEQITKLNTFGVEFSARWAVNEGFFRSVHLSYGYISADKSAQGQISKYALDYMNHKLVGSVDVRFLRNFTASLTGSLYSRTGNYTDRNGTTKSYKPYFLLDARVQWERKWLRVYCDGTNLTSTRYFDYGGMLMPKIWASAGVSVLLCL